MDLPHLRIRGGVQPAGADKGQRFADAVRQIAIAGALRIGAQKVQIPLLHPVQVGETAAPAEQPVELILDSPFFYAVVDLDSGAPLFIGVMDDPAPVTALIALADSTINFELRAYVPELADRIRVTNDLYQTIVERFAAAGIEISFPQMDVHLRDWPPQPPAGTSAPGVVVSPAVPGAVSAPAVPSRPQS